MSSKLLSFVAGLLFSMGLVISGMVEPSKVKAFLDIFGYWDPSLAFVMIGAIATHLMAYRYIKKRSSPVFGGDFHLPSKKELDKQLLVGALLFGAGWGLGGFCPGPAVTSFAAFNIQAFTFVGAMLAGMGFFALLKKLKLI